MTLEEWFDRTYPINERGSRPAYQSTMVMDLMRMAWQGAERQAIERAAIVCDEYGELMAAEKDSALLVGKVDLSNAMSGEPRAAEFLARTIRALVEQNER